MTDAVESLICALYLSSKCLRTCLEWTSFIKLVPITFAKEIIDKFNFKVDYTMRQYRPLNEYEMSTDDNVDVLFRKYFKV